MLIFICSGKVTPGGKKNRKKKVQVKKWAKVGAKGAPTAQNFKDAAKTAKKT